MNKEIASINDIFSEIEEYHNNRNIEFPYFVAIFYKKGTCHIKFKNIT